MENIGANSKEWWTEDRRESHSLKIKEAHAKKSPQGKRNLPEDFSEKCRQGQIDYTQRKDTLIMESTPFEEWPVRLIRKHLFSEIGNKCQICNFEYTDPVTGKGPFQIHHIDGDKKNWKRLNLEIRCLNCHWMTPNFAFRGRNHTNETKKLLADKANAFYKQKLI